MNPQVKGIQTRPSSFVYSAPDTLKPLLFPEPANMPQGQGHVGAILSAWNAIFPHVNMVHFFASFRSLLKYQVIREVFHDHPIFSDPPST